MPARREQRLLSGLFFLQWGAAALWNVCLGTVLRHHGLEAWIPYAFACNGLAAFISPLIVGALADRQIPPVRLLRHLNFLGAATLALCYLGIDAAWGPAALIGSMLLHALCATPVFSLASSIVFSRLENPGRDYGAIRIWATLGWAFCGWAVSALLHADLSTRSGYAAAALMLVLGVLTWLLPETPPADESRGGGWRARFGLDALPLLLHRDHRMVFLTTFLLTIPLAAFYPFTPLHLADLGLKNPAALLSLGQVTEALCLLALGGIWARFRLKWILLGGIACAFLRYALFSFNTPATLLVGISLHGICYTLYFIGVQVYLAERIDRAWKARAQALLTLLVAGLGNLLGYLGTGWWRAACVLPNGHTHWPRYWSGLCASTLLVAVLFLLFYRGRGTRPQGSNTAQP